MSPIFVMPPYGCQCWDYVVHQEHQDASSIMVPFRSREYWNINVKQTHTDTDTPIANCHPVLINNTIWFQSTCLILAGHELFWFYGRKADVAFRLTALANAKSVSLAV